MLHLINNPSGSKSEYIQFLKQTIEKSQEINNKKKNMKSSLEIQYYSVSVMNAAESKALRRF